MARHSWLRFLRFGQGGLARASFPKVEDAGQPDHDGSHKRIQRAGHQIARWHLRVGWQSIHLRFVDEKIKRVEPSQHLLVGPVKIRSVLAGLVQLLHSCLCFRVKLPDGSKLDRFRRAGFRAGWLHAALQPVVTEGAFLSCVRDWIDVNHTKGAGPDTVPAAVAGIRLDDNGIELSADNRTCGADLEAGGVDTVLANIAHQEPAAVLPVFGELLDELDMAPVGTVQPARVVIAVAAQCVQTAVGAGKLIPLFAGDFAGFAADADCRVGEKSHRLSHNASFTLSRCCTQTPWLRESLRWDRRQAPSARSRYRRSQALH